LFMSLFAVVFLIALVPKGNITSWLMYEKCAKMINWMNGISNHRTSGL
jgi:hypothetical protein